MTGGMDRHVLREVTRTLLYLHQRLLRHHHGAQDLGVVAPHAASRIRRQSGGFQRNVLAEYLRNIVLKELTKKTVKNRQKTVRSGSVRVNFGPKFSEPKILNFKNFQFVRPSPPRRGPSSRPAEPRRPEGPRGGGDGRTN